MAADVSVEPGSVRLRRRLLRPVLVAVAIDLLLAPFTAQPNDMSVWFVTSASGYQSLGLYDRPGFAYPPVVGYLLVGLGRALRALGVSLGSLATSDRRLRPMALATGSDTSGLVTSPLYNVANKLLLIAPQIAIGLLIAYVVRRCGGSSRRASLAAAVWLLNPLVLAEVGIHAGIDVWVGLFSLLAAVLVIDRRPAWGGAMLALGILTKLTPLFIGPALFAVALRDEPETTRPNLNAGLRFLSGLAAAFAAILVSEGLFGSLRAMLDNSLVRGQTGLTGVGGLSVFGARYLRPFNGLTAWTFAHSSGVVRATTLVDVAVAIAAAGWAYRVARRNRHYAVLASCAFVYLTLLLTAPVTNPQYLVWCLPLIIAVAGAWNRSMFAPIALGVVGTVYYFVIFGPLWVFLPLAEYSSALSVERVVKSTQQWYAAPSRLWGSNLAGDYLAPCAIAAVIVMAALMLQLVRQPSRRDDDVRSGRAPRGRQPVQLAAALVVIALAAELFVEFGVTNPVAGARLVSVHKVGATLEAQIDAPGTSDIAHLELVGVPVAAAPRTRDLFAYVDSTYPISGSTDTAQVGFPYHLRSDAKLSRYAGTIMNIDATQLASTLRDLAAAPRRVVTVMSGAFPRNVLSTHVDLVSPWVRAGGTLIWAGDEIGYYSALPHVALDFNDPVNLRDQGPTRLLGVDSVRPSLDPYALGTVPTTAARALGLQYDRTGTAVSSDFAVGHGGEVLGWEDGAYNSIATVPRGRGMYVVFGGGVDDEAVAAHDVMRILTAGVIDRAGPISARAVRVTRSNGHDVVDASLAVPAAAHEIVLSLVDTDPLGVYAWSWSGAIP